MNEATVVLVRDDSSGKIHRRTRVVGVKDLASFEGDNADASGSYTIITADELGNADAADLCGRCFPTNDAPE